jgi:CHU_C Type IX secretion signal domain/Bacterial Ig-like domain
LIICKGNYHDVLSYIVLVKKLTFIYLFVVFFSQLSAQLTDDFSDRNMTSNPVWFGNTDDFIINEDLQLQLSAESGGKSILCTSLQIPDSVRWDMYINLQFAPSSSNKLRIYLLLDTFDLTIANGYYCEIGQNGSADPIHFFSLEDGQSFLLGSSTLTFENEVDLQLSIILDSKGRWTFYADIGDGIVNDILRVSDATFQPDLTRSFCFECYYTNTRKDKFAFDNIMVDELKPDVTPPVLIEVNVIDSATIELTFNENIGTEIKKDNILIEPEIGSPATVLVVNHKLQIELERNLISGRTYTCTTLNIPDTAQNISGTQVMSFDYIKISSPQAGDIAINEILFDPKSGDSPFIELYNISGKYFNCSDIVLSIEKNSAFETISNFAECLLTPDLFIVFTNDRISTIFNYPNGEESAIFETKLPTLSRDSGSIILLNRSGKIIDSVYYSTDFHHILLDDSRGVSLERISPTSPALSQSDWNSASGQSGWGTPGLPNSQYIRFDSVTAAFHLENRIFSPDGDGYNDFLLIRFSDAVAGQLATTRVYDEFGREVSVLLRNELLGSGSTIKWDGTVHARDKASSGIYILLVEIMQETGIVTMYKEPVILAAGL